MKPAYELLESAPHDQITRMKLAINSIANGNWDEAAHFLRNAAREGARPECWHWATAVEDLAVYCEAKSKKLK